MNNQITLRSISVTPVQKVSGKGRKMLTPVETALEKPDEIALLVHEIRNPLSTLSLSAEMLKSILTSDDQKMLLDMVIRGSVRINDILTELYTSYRGNNTEPEKYSIHQLLDEALAMACDRIMLKHITIRKNYDSRELELVLNRAQIKIAFTNIIINAIDAMTHGKGVLTLTTTTSGDTCVVRIEDNGCGIRQENLKNIFRPYFTGKPGGLGLGLATTLDILRSNHIGLTVKSAEAKGTCFILRFRERHP